jgi:EmrB/QacA subfamily drug resistance transporter
MIMAGKRWTLTAICLATFMLLLDITIVQVALPSIQHDLHASLTGLQWVVDAYALPLCALVISFGTIADKWGRRRMFIYGLVVFTAASVACAVAPTLEALAVSRAIQGVGGAAMFATALALIGQEFEGAARGTAIAAWGSTVGAAVAAGPLVGGLLIRAADWPWIFYVNVPVGVIAVVLTLRHVSEGTEADPRPLDVPGLLTLSLGLLALIEGLLRGATDGWTERYVLASLIAAVVLLTAFVLLQRRDGAMIPRTLYRSRPFNGLSFATFAIGAGMFAMFLYITVYLQNVLGLTPLQAGVRMLSVTSLVFAVPLITRRLGWPVVSGPMVGTGLAFVAVGLLLMTLAGTGTSWQPITPGLVVAGIGIGLANPAIAATALAVVPRNRSGLAAGVSNTSRLAGLATGIAALGALFQIRINQILPSGSHDAGALVAAGRLHDAARTVPLTTANHAFDAGFHLILVTGAVTLAIGSLAAFVFVRRSAVGESAPSAPAVAETAGR